MGEWDGLAPCCHPPTGPSAGVRCRWQSDSRRAHLRLRSGVRRYAWEAVAGAFRSGIDQHARFGSGVRKKMEFDEPPLAAGIAMVKSVTSTRV